MRATVFRDEQACDLALDSRGDDDRPRFGEGLDPRSDIRCLAEHCTGRVHHDLVPGRYALQVEAGFCRRSWR